VLWLALYLPALPLQAYSRSLVETAPIVVFEREAARTRVITRNRLAAKLGIHKHMPLATAHALCDALIALPREPLRETALLERLASVVAQFTPNVHIQHGFGLLLDISASIQLFGGVQNLLSQTQTAITRHNIRAHTVIAPTASGARWLARAHRQLIVEHDVGPWLDDLAFNCTDFTPAFIDEWHALNLHHLAALRRLPSAALGKRFGAETTLALARAYGEANETFAYWQPVTRFDEHIEFLDLARESTHWMPGVEALLQQLQQFLQSRAAAAQRIEFIFQLGTIDQTAITLEAAHPTHRIKDWLRLINAKLERQPVAHEVSRIELSTEHITALTFTDTDLFERHRETDRDWKSLLHLLKLRMGAGALKTPRCNVNALPESGESRESHDSPDSYVSHNSHTSHTTHASHTLPASKSQNTANDNDLRPNWLIDPPRMLSTREVGRFIASIHLQQPERIHEPWSQPDGTNATQRDYYIAQTPDHRALWVYREKPRNEWFLQGIFA
jgi:protein ImuB